ncbi:hypothetical protein JCM10213_000315 [Rhodosporidiobolus nylandii]
MREAKRARTVAPTSSFALPSSSAPSSDNTGPPASSQSLSDLRNRLQSAALPSGTPSTLASATWQPLASEMAGGSGGSGRGSGPPGRSAGGEANGEDDIMDVEAKESKPTQALPSDIAASSQPAAWPQALPSQAAFASDAPQAGPESSSLMALPSPTQKRSKEEIQRRKEEALLRRKVKEDAKKADERQRRRQELATMQLSAFGFSIKQGGISRYGSGKGGIMVKEEPNLLPEKWEPDARCSPEQLQCLDHVEEGKNIFFTGSAGVGKSFLLKEITRLLEHLKRPFQVTATTGIAALQVSGMTIYSWAGIGLGKEPISILYDRIYNKPEKRKIWLETQVLIIDEISMAPADLLTKLNILGKMLRNNNKPFGGIQVVVSGDFFQLPPVPEKMSEAKCARCGHHHLQKIDIHDSRLPYEERAKGVPQSDIWRCTDLVKRNGEVVGGCGFEWRMRRFSFETETWAESDFRVLELTKVFRQDHPEFIATLEKFRRGVCDEAAVEFLKTCGTELGKEGKIKIQPTNLYPLKKDVDGENAREFARLKEQQFTFAALDDSRGGYAKTQVKERLANVPPPQTLQLKKGAQVLLLANLDVKGGLVNGSRGVIVDWVDKDDVPIDAEDDERLLPNPTQKAGVRGGAFGGEEWRMKAADEWADKQKEAVYPLVYFATGRQLIIKPHSWCIDIDKDNTVARTQLPLQLAWALTIHKSQGQSLDAVGVRLTSTFEKGQAYVALSRCRKPEGMKIEGFRPGVVMADPTVQIFYTCIKESTPFFVSPVSPINPLAYIVDFDPLMHKLAKTFGRPPVPLPVGSAVLAPGQTLAPPRPKAGAAAHKAAQAAAQKSAKAASTVASAANPAQPRSWQDLLEQAAKAYVVDAQRRSKENDGIVDDSSAFVAEAKRAVLAATSTAAAAMDVEEASEYETAESVISVESRAGGWGEEGKKKKKGRKRKATRVGH